MQGIRYPFQVFFFIYSLFRSFTIASQVAFPNHTVDIEVMATLPELLYHRCRS